MTSIYVYYSLESHLFLFSICSIRILSVLKVLFKNTNPKNETWLNHRNKCNSTSTTISQLRKRVISWLRLKTAKQETNEQFSRDYVKQTTWPHGSDWDSIDFFAAFFIIGQNRTSFLVEKKTRFLDDWPHSWCSYFTSGILTKNYS